MRKQISEKTAMRDFTPKRYYVQCLSPQVFLIRERLFPQEHPDTNDRLIRSFAFRHDADIFAEEANQRQQVLDQTYGQWQHSAMLQEN